MQLSNSLRQATCMTSFALKQTLTKTNSITLTLTCPVPVPTAMLLPLEPLQSIQCRWKSRNKWEKLKAKFPPAVPSFDYSGDNDLNLPAEFKDDESIFTKLNIDQSEIDSANYPLFSIQNADKKDQMKLLVDKVKEKFGRDETDDNSLELKVALLTLRTRNLIRHVQAYPKDKINKSKLVEVIQKRRSLLKQLQAYDIERFEWVCKELNLTYIPYPQYTRPLPKRSKVRGAAITEMLELKESKLNELKQSLAVERKEYYAKKSEIMKAISQHRDELLKEAEELKSSQINTGYPGNSGSKAYDLAHIKIVDKEKWWRKHPEVLKIVYGNRPFKGYK